MPAVVGYLGLAYLRYTLLSLSVSSLAPVSRGLSKERGGIFIALGLVSIIRQVSVGIKPLLKYPLQHGYRDTD